MFRLTQFFRNSFIRLEGLLYQLFGFFRQILGFFYQLIVAFGRLLGFSSETEYFQEPNAEKVVKSSINERKTRRGGNLHATSSPVAQQPQEAQSAPATTRRRPDASMDYYLKLAQPRTTRK